MIEVIIDHSYEDDYFMISEIRVNIKDLEEKARIMKYLNEHDIVGALVNADRMLTNRLASILNVDAKLIDIDTNEIDLM